MTSAEDRSYTADRVPRDWRLMGKQDSPDRFIDEDTALKIEKTVYAKVFGATPPANDGLSHGPGCPCYGCSVQDT